MTRREPLAVAVVQAALGAGGATNVERVEELVREAAAGGAGVVLPPELFEGPYFPKTRSDRWFATARPLAGHPTVARFQNLAAQFHVVIPVSFFERDGSAYYNSVAVVDADGALLGCYRKSHIPDGPGYEEKHYFDPGDTGFRVWSTRYGRIGVGICWDQWFPECARAMALAGAELLLYPSAIGSEPEAPEFDTSAPWRRVMVGHAVANSVPLAASNRIGDEDGQIFYGQSFLADERGEVVGSLGSDEQGVALARFDLDEIERYRAGFGLGADRRPELYVGLTRPPKSGDR